MQGIKARGLLLSHNASLSSMIDNVKWRVWITREEVGGARENVVACGYYDDDRPAKD